MTTKRFEQSIEYKNYVSTSISNFPSAYTIIFLKRAIMPSIKSNPTSGLGTNKVFQNGIFLKFKLVQHL